ncbi:trehalose-phosphatase [Methylosinus sp. 3S-1]
MNIPAQRANLQAAAAEVAERIMCAPHAYALFLDLDGTLLDIAERPDAVRVEPGLASDLDRLRDSLAGALAIVSGRTLDDIDGFLHPLRFDAAAEHGSTLRLADGDSATLAATIDPDVVAAVESAAGTFAGVTVERKRSALAVHYRAAPHAAETLAAAMRDIVARSGAELRLIAGRCVYELTPALASKARAVESLSSFFPFAGRRPIFIGDDASDEEACALVERCGGAALAVAGEYFAPERSAFAGPAQVRRWIATLAADLRAACGDRGR